MTNMEKLLQTPIEPTKLENLYVFDEYDKFLNKYVYETINTPVINPTTVVSMPTITSPISTGPSISISSTSPTFEASRPVEINYCKDCVYFENGKDCGYCYFHDTQLNEDDYCSFFEFPENL